MIIASLNSRYFLNIYRRFIYWFARRLLLFASIGTLLVSFSARAYNLNRAIDISEDEAEYLNISHAIANHFHIELFGTPFFLHPPLFFFFEALYLKIYSPGGQLIDQIYSARYLVVIAGAFSAVALVHIVRYVAGWKASIAALALFAIDPYIVFLNSQNLLETPAMLWVLLGYWLLLSSCVSGDLLRPTRPRALAIGLLFGLALLTKDTTAFLTIAPLGALFLINWSLPRRITALILISACITYAPYPIITAAVGQWSNFSRQKFAGLERVLGIVQITGFHHPGAPSFTSTLIARLGLFGATYAIVLAGVIAVAVQVYLGGARNRLVAMWVASAYGYLGFAIIQGTLEPQFFYFLVVPAIVSTTCAASQLLTKEWSGPSSKLIPGLLLPLFVLVLGWGGYNWTRVHFLAGDSYGEALTYINARIPPDQRQVAATSQTGQFLLGAYSAPPWGDWTTAAQLAKYRPYYVLIGIHQVVWDHAQAAPALQAWLHINATLVFTVVSNGTGTDGPLLLYRLPWAPDNVAHMSSAMKSIRTITGPLPQQE